MLWVTPAGAVPKTVVLLRLFPILKGPTGFRGRLGGVLGVIHGSPCSTGTQEEAVNPLSECVAANSVIPVAFCLRGGRVRK